MTDPDDHATERAFRFDEKYLFQTPALEVLVELGYQYLAAAEAFTNQWRLSQLKEIPA